MIDPVASDAGAAAPVGRAAEELRGEMAAMLNAMQEGCALVNEDFVFAEANDAFCRMHGRSRAEVLGCSLGAVCGTDQFDDILQPRLQSCFANEVTRGEEAIEVATTEGRRYAIDFHPYAPAGRVTHAVLVVRDDTDRRRTTGEMRLLLDLMQSIHLAPDIESALGAVLQRVCEDTGWVIGQVWGLSASTTLLEWRAGWHRGRPEFEVFLHASQSMRFQSGEGLPGLVWARKAPVWIENYSHDTTFFRAKLAHELGLPTVVGIPVKADGRLVAVIEFRTTCAGPEDPRVMEMLSGVASLVGTVFERRLAQEQIDRFFDRSIDLHCIASVDGYLRRVNVAWEQISGFSARELVGRPWVEFVHPDDRPAFLGEFDRMKEGRAIVTFEMRTLIKAGGYVWTSWNATMPAGQNLIVATGRNITENKRADEAIRQSEEHYRELFHEAYQMQQNLRRLSDRVLQVQEQERTRLSRELHDEVGQALTAVSIHLAVLKRELAPDQEGLREKTDSTQRMLQRTMEAVHRFAVDLRPAMLDDLGLVPAMRSHIKKYSEHTGIAVTFSPDGHGQLDELDPESKTVIYRTLQEALNNAAKHGHATAVTVSLAPFPGEVVLSVADNGCGFDAESQIASRDPERLGLLGISERVRLVSGNVTIESHPGRGASLRVSIPFKPS